MSTTSSAPAAIEASGLSLRYGRGRRAALALQDCSFRVPAGSVCALVGPNGAGKSTLLRIIAGLIRPDSGAGTGGGTGTTVDVLGAAPGTHRDRVGYLDQDQPLYGHLSIADTLALGARLNAGHWDAACAARIVEQGSLDPKSKIRRLSGGQRTRVALALTLGKRPELLLLDEPMAELDPLARQQLMGLLLADAAENGTTVLLSSHIVAELAYSCDHLLLLGDGRVRLGGSVEELLAAHTVVTGRGSDLSPHTVIESRPTGRGRTALIRPRGPLADGWQTQEPTLEELLLAHLRAPSSPAFLTPEMRGATARAA
ncbi:ABC transporter ATP-binding protein [Streptomyces sp. NBC_00859]|uniref:ABC transporter ATP-binding protein n=1 Tax=Streptomyces sp. NBC_00859 TaxID=2903682 RepID=UPI0038641FCC|nr:ABC transporter ATP-binding protein [Streptomyces sp. NBC_00859]